MDFAFAFGDGLFTFVVLPVLIFLARILDVSLGTMRIIFISRGMRYLAPVVGFFEVMVWLLAITQVMQNLTNFITYIAYAGGFTAGTFMGIYIESRIAMGHVSISVLTKKDPAPLLDKLEDAGYRTTTVESRGKKSTVQMIFTILRRKRLGHAMNIIKSFDKDVFYSIEDVKYLHDISCNVSHAAKHHHIRRLFSLMSKRKGK